MRIYFSTTNLKYGLREALLETQPKHMLFSYWYRSCYGEWKDLLQHLSKPTLMIDSGAFSAWTSGKRVDREDYLQFIRKCQTELSQYVSEMYFVNLDFIPGAFGRKPNALEIQQSAEIGWQNYEWFKRQGITTIHIFHQHEDWNILKRIASVEEYIGISPANDLPNAQRLPWLRDVFSIIRDTKRTHCFGGTSKDLLYSVPFFSADSSSYAISRIFTPKWERKRVEINPRRRDIIPMIRKKIREEIIAKQRLEVEATNLWKMRGIQYK